MDLAQAKEELGFHCGRDPRIEDPRWQDGFLSTLRPYRGLRRDVMSRVLDCVEAVEEHLASAPELDRDIVSSLWGIVHFGQAWAIRPDGMLRSNSLISDAEVRELDEWLSDLSLRIAMILDGNVP